MRIILALAMCVALTAPASAKIYSTLRVYKDPEVAKREAQEQLREISRQSQRCIEQPYQVFCPQPKSTEEKMLDELRLLRKELAE